jgi:hypothetical protein
MQHGRMPSAATDLLALGDLVDRLNRDKILNDPLVSAHANASIASPGT